MVWQLPYGELSPCKSFQSQGCCASNVVFMADLAYLPWLVVATIRINEAPELLSGAHKMYIVGDNPNAHAQPQCCVVQASLSR